MRKIIFTGGGTGGHVFPALAVVDALTAEEQRRVLWIGSRHGMERALVKNHGLPYRPIPVGKLRRYLDMENLWDLFRFLAGILAARRVLRREGCSVVFSKGGFVSVPVVLAGWSLKIPVIIHESDDDPGLATRIATPFARHICVAREEVRRRFRSPANRRVVVTGNPVRQEFLSADPAGALAAFGMQDTGLPVVLVTGGSQGARQINDLLRSIVGELTSRCVVVHQTGDHGAGEIPDLQRLAEAGRYLGVPSFGDEFPALMRRADLVVARAGAGTIWELAVTGTPSILIPLPGSASRGDQIRNARRYADSGAAIVLDPDTVSAAELKREILSLFENVDRRQHLSSSALAYAPADGGRRIAGLLRQAIESNVQGVSWT